MELGFIENLRRRWNVLGIITHNDGGKTEKPSESSDRHDDGDGGNEPDEATSREEIMQGAIVKSVIASAVQGTSGIICENIDSQTLVLCL
jgi:hypothetical protein